MDAGFITFKAYTNYKFRNSYFILRYGDCSLKCSKMTKSTSPRFMRNIVYLLTVRLVVVKDKNIVRTKLKCYEENVRSLETMNLRFEVDTRKFLWLNFSIKFELTSMYFYVNHPIRKTYVRAYVS
jgi:hypothetical protein